MHELIKGSYCRYFALNIIRIYKGMIFNGIKKDKAVENLKDAYDAVQDNKVISKY